MAGLGYGWGDPSWLLSSWHVVGFLTVVRGQLAAQVRPPCAARRLPRRRGCGDHGAEYRPGCPCRGSALLAGPVSARVL